MGGGSNVVQCLPGLNAVLNFTIFRKKDDTEVVGANVYGVMADASKRVIQPQLIECRGQSARGLAHSKTLRACGNVRRFEIFGVG
jgi:hypothetical protein